MKKKSFHRFKPTVYKTPHFFYFEFVTKFSHNHLFRLYLQATVRFNSIQCYFVPTIATTQQWKTLFSPMEISEPNLTKTVRIGMCIYSGLR